MKFYKVIGTCVNYEYKVDVFEYAIRTETERSFMILLKGSSGKNNRLDKQKVCQIEYTKWDEVERNFSCFAFVRESDVEYYKNMVTDKILNRLKIIKDHIEIKIEAIQKSDYLKS